MSVVLWVLGALAAGIIAEEFLGWVTPACRVILRRGARRLPDVWQARYGEEWQAELLALPEAALTRMLWTARTVLGVRTLRATLAESWADRQADRKVAVPELSLPSTWPASGHEPTVLTTVLMITLGAELRRLREARGIDLTDAGWAIRSSASKVTRLERGRVRLKERDLLDLLDLYGVTDASEIQAFQRLVRQSENSGWWHQYADLLPSRQEAYIGLEQSASLIRTYESHYIPGLLQTPDYARAVIGNPTRLSATEIDRAVDTRIRRQQVLTGLTPARLWAVIDEATLRRPFGGVNVMRAQIEHLIEASKLPNVTVQVLPFNSGGGVAAAAFTVLQLPESDLPNIVYLELLTSALYLDSRSEIDHYLTVLDQITVAAVPPSKTRDVLGWVLSDLG